MNAYLPTPLLLFTAVLCTLNSCNSQTTDLNQEAVTGQQLARETYKEGSDYLLFERVRILDKAGFTEPQEAYSVLLPKGWKSEGAIVWNTPGSSCAGTFSSLKAKSADGNYSFEVYPATKFSGSSAIQTMGKHQGKRSSTTNR